MKAEYVLITNTENKPKPEDKPKPQKKPVKNKNRFFIGAIFSAIGAGLDKKMFEDIFVNQNFQEYIKPETKPETESENEQSKNYEKYVIIATFILFILIITEL